MTDLSQLVRILTLSHVEFIIVGGAAATAHGSSRLTEDLDIVYRRTSENAERLSSALGPYEPYLRGAPPGLPFVWGAETIWKGLNFTLQTSLGSLDVLGEILGGGGYDDLVSASVCLEIEGVEVLCLGLERLIQVKRAAGRPKDFEAIGELEAILEERNRQA
jgi:hypothetical protein